MDCNEVLEKLELLLDGELPESEKQQVFDHIKKCQNCECKNRYDAERCFKEYIQQALFPKKVSTAIVQDIKSYVTQHV